MCPTLKNEEFQWEAKLKGITNAEELGRLNEEAHEEIGGDYANNWASYAKANKLRMAESTAHRKQAWERMEYILAQALANLESGKPILDGIQLGTPSQAMKSPASEQQFASPPPPPPPPGMQAPPPPPPGVPGAGIPKQESEEQKARREAQEAKKNQLLAAKARAQKVNTTQLDEELKIANEDFKKAETEYNSYLNGKPAYSGSPLSREQAYKNRQGIVDDLNVIIKEQQDLVNQLTSELEVLKADKELQSSPDHKDQIAIYESLISEEQVILVNVTADAKKTVVALNSFVEEYVKEEAKLKQQMDVQKAYRDELVIRTKEKKDVVKGPVNKNALKDAFSDRKMAIRMGDMANYSPAEQIKIRNYFYKNGANTAKDNAYLWTPAELGKRLMAKIQLQKISYEELKAVVGRPLFKDENNPTEVAVRSSGPGFAAAQDATKLSLTVAGGDSPSKPQHQAPTEPQKKLSDLQAALIVIKNSLKSTDIQQRYDRSGNKKSFVSMYLKSQDKARPKQISMLQEAVVKASTDLESLLKLKKNLQKSNSPMSESEIEKHVANTLSELEATIQNVSEQIDSSHHKKGTSRMVNVLSNLTKEVDLMKKAMGIEAPKPGASKRM